MTAKNGLKKMKNIMKPKQYKAKLKCNPEITVVGYYFEMRETTHCFDKGEDIPIHYYLIVDEMTDWNLPNEARMYEIEIDTLEEL